jgi:hypothetical protein
MQPARHKMELCRLLLALFVVHTAARVEAEKPGKNAVCSQETRQSTDTRYTRASCVTTLKSAQKYRVES